MFVDAKGKQITKFDFGVVARGADVRHRFLVRNKYKQTIHISNVRTTCGCSAASPSKTTLASGETVYIEVTMDTRRFSRRKDSNLIVTFDRPAYAEVRIPITSYIRTDVVLTPGAANFGAVEKGKSAARSIDIAYAGRNDWTIRDVKVGSKYLSKKLEQTRRANGQVNYRLTLQLDASAPVGKLREQIVLVTDDANSPYVPILVEARVEADAVLMRKLSLIRCLQQSVVRFSWMLGLAVIVSSTQSAEAGSLKSAVESIQSKQLRRHVEVLASDTFEGREAGSRGGRAAGVYIVEKLKKLGVKPAGVDGSFYQEFGNGYRNILATLPGRNAKRKQEFVVICAHYDHVGYGTRQNSLGAIGYIHNGADDNASGTSALLEVIEAFQELGVRPERSILFAFWDAEEKGLLGARHWVANPTVPLKQIQLAVNIDMIGRLRKNRLTIIGSRSGYGLRNLLSEQNRDTRLELDFEWTIKRDSDHYPFLRYRIPAVMFHTGKHSDYHTPNDDSHKVNYADMQRVSRFAFLLTRAASSIESLPRYREAALRETNEHRAFYEAALPAKPVRLGITWSAETDADGPLLIASVEPNSAAYAAGMRPGDRIERFNGYAIRGPGRFRAIVHASPNIAAVRLLRKGVTKPIDIQVRLNGFPSLVGVSWNAFDSEPNTVYLRRVIPGTAADNAGLKIGDRILAVSRKRFRTSDQFRDMIATRERTLELTVDRNGVIRHVLLSLLGPPGSEPVRAKRPRRSLAKSR
eukprot:g10241.t1